MKINLLITIILLVITAFNNCFGQGYEYTIIANTNLNLRELADQRSKIIYKLKPFDIVYSEVAHKEFIDYQVQSKVKIDGKSGFWIEIEYQGIKGHVFSPYLIPRNLSNVKDESIKYNILGTGTYCFEGLKWNTKLKYFIINSRTLSLHPEEVSMLIETNYQTDEFLHPSVYGRYPGLNISIDGIDTTCTVIGIEKVKNDSIIRHPQNLQKPINIFLDTHEVYRVSYEGDDFELCGKKSINGNYQIIYTHLKNGQLIQSTNLNEFIYPNIKHEYLLNFDMPQLIYYGDINYDLKPDVIILSNNLPDGCRVEWKYHLFLSSDVSGISHFILNTGGTCN